MSYLINFAGLNFIFANLIGEFPELAKFNSNGKFNLGCYMSERKVSGSPTDGLNEIESLQVFKVKDIEEKKANIDIRWYTNKLISKLLFTRY